MAEAARPARPNRLAGSASPYLRQHAYQPVDWYPWGAEAIERARREDRPILLSVGYSACHWCHVMAHESFDDPEVARVMNELFVCVKVDREERPDVDQVYQLVCQLLTGQGGWPLTVFLTPDLKPFYAGTYFPPRPRFGRPAFVEVLEACARAYRERRQELLRHADRLAEAARAALNPVAPRGATGLWASARDNAAGRPGAGGPSAQALVQAAEALLSAADGQAGGFGRAPKFPHATGLELLWRVAWRFGHEGARRHLAFTLEAMAAGGIYDHVGGGFHRYAVDRWWQVPHFEKMLYDNALLAPLYARVGRWLGRPGLVEVARGTLDFLLEEMRLDAGGFAASLDADSPDGEGRPAEGHFYRWTAQEVREAVGDPELAAAVCAEYGIGHLTARAGPEGAAGMAPAGLSPGDGPPGWLEEAATVVSRWPGAALTAPPAAPPGGEVGGGRQGPGGAAEAGRAQAAALSEALRRMKAYRQARRARPARDEKVVLAWHALTLSAMVSGFEAAVRPDPKRYLRAAEEGWAFVFERMRDPSGGLLHTPAGPGAGQAIPAFADDYAFLIHAGLDLYRCTQQEAYLQRAAELADEARRRFAQDGVYWLSSERHGSPLARSRDIWDQVTPSANAAMAAAHARLAALLDDPSHLEQGQRIVETFWPVMREQVSGTAGMWCALDRLDGGTACVTVYSEDLEGVREALARLVGLAHPGLEVRWRRGEGEPRYILCVGTACRNPEAHLEAVLTQLQPAEHRA